MLSNIDILLLIALLIICYFTALQVKTGRVSLDEFFLARGKFRWWSIGFVCFVANSAFPTYIAIGDWGYKEGLMAFNFELTGIVCCIIVSLFFSKIYYDNKIFTTSEYVERRFGTTVGYITSLLLILTYIVGRISIILIACCILLQYFFKFDIYTCCIFLVAYSGSYSVVCGQRSIFYNGIFMGVFLLIGGFLLTYFVVQEYYAVPRAALPEAFFHVTRPVNSKGFNWIQIGIALPIIGIWYHCVNQELIQKYLAAKNIQEIQKGALLHGALKLLVFPLVILPAMLALPVFGDMNTETMFPKIIQTLVPDYLKGIVVFGLVGSGIVGLSSNFNACATIFTFNFYRKIYPNANDFVLMNIGKLATIVIVIVSMVWLVLLQSINNNLVTFVSFVLTYFTPPFAVIYLMGIFWSRATNRAAIATLIVGLIVGTLKFVLYFMHDQNPFVDPFWAAIADFNFFYFSIVLFAFCMVVMVVTSLLDTAPDKESIQHLLFRMPDWKSFSAEEKKQQKLIYVFAGLLFATILSIYGFLF